MPGPWAALAAHSPAWQQWDSWPSPALPCSSPCCWPRHCCVGRGTVWFPSPETVRQTFIFSYQFEHRQSSRPVPSSLWGAWGWGWPWAWGHRSLSGPAPGVLGLPGRELYGGAGRAVGGSFP